MLKNNIILQSETSECGLACIATVLNHFGYGTDLSDLRRRFGSAERGMTLRSVISIAEKCDLIARPIKLNYVEVRQLPRYSILHWNGNHFVIFVSKTYRYYNIIDPAVGLRKIRFEDFKRSFTGVAVELSPSHRFQVRKYKRSSIVPRLLAAIPHLYRSLSKLLLLSFVLEIISLISPFFSQIIIDEVVMTHDNSLLKGVAFAVFSLSVIQFGTSLARGQLSINFQQSGSQRIKISVLRHLMGLPIEWFSRRHLGDIVTRFSGINTIQNTFTTVAMQNVLDGIMAIFTGAMVISYGGWIGIVACLSVLIDIILKFSLYAQYRAITISSASLDARQQNHFLETIRNISMVKMSNLMPRRIIEWSNINVNISNIRSSQQRIELIVSKLQELASGIDRSIVLYLGGGYVLQNEMTIGTFIAFLSYKEQTDRRISNLTTSIVRLRSLSVQSERLRDIIGTPEEAAPRTRSYFSRSYKALDISIAASQLSKRYQSESPWVFHNANFTIEPGSRVIIRGPSGCGKTTLLKVLIGLIHPSSGSLLVGECSRSPQALHEYRARFGGIMQDDTLFSGTILENISSFDPKPDLDRLESCAKSAMIFDEISKLPMGLHTVVSASASTLSGGQRQRIQLARTLYLDAPIIFLDEATNQIDEEMEETLMFHLSQLRKTILFVSHRPSLIRYANMSLTFKGSDIVCSYL